MENHPAFVVKRACSMESLMVNNFFFLFLPIQGSEDIDGLPHMLKQVYKFWKQRSIVSQ
jgi:hypothetical protein